ncbi:class I SAM-dependent methyltransferase [Streptomyces sp. NPDC001941]|uniref:class I SAM-dependent methyltransferase n=1 Tax=Streptomyces sp. NPDC001941 TaxID=3154659 RepID=UPI003317B403
MEYSERQEWDQHYADGKGFRRLSEREKALLAERAAPPGGGGRAVEVGSGAGDLALHLASVGYRVDAVDFAESAITRARAGHPDAGVRWICADIEHDDVAGLDPGGYDLVVIWTPSWVPPA